MGRERAVKGSGHDEFECTWKDVQSTGRGARSLGVVRLDDSAPGFGVRDLDVRDGETVRLFAAGRETCRGDAHFDVYRLDPDGLVQLLDGSAVSLPGFPAPQRAVCRWAAPATARRALECLAFDDSLRLWEWDGEAGANVGAVDRFVLRYEEGRLVADPNPERVPVVCRPDETCRPRR